MATAEESFCVMGKGLSKFIALRTKTYHECCSFEEVLWAAAKGEEDVVDKDVSSATRADDGGFD